MSGNILVASPGKGISGTKERETSSVIGLAVHPRWKKARTAIAYLYNNPVEKHLCGKAEEFQWNFLDYSQNDHPFSDPFTIRSARRVMRRAVAEVRVLREADIPLGYDFIDRIIKGLNLKEIRQLTDYIIVQYNCVDYQDLASYYDDFETLLIAVHSNTGSEYQIKEEITPGSDSIFQKMSATIKKMTPYKDMKEVLAQSDVDKHRIAWILSAETGATPRQISKFLQLPLS